MRATAYTDGTPLSRTPSCCSHSLSCRRSAYSRWLGSRAGSIRWPVTLPTSNRHRRSDEPGRRLAPAGRRRCAAIAQSLRRLNA